MNFKNKHNVPPSLEPALKGGDYPDHPDNVISCTQLIDAPKNRILQQRHDSEIEIDVSKRAWMVFGSAIHYYLEKTAGANALSEERWYLDTKTWECNTGHASDVIYQSWYHPNVTYISGQFDLYEDGVLSDYKVTSVWSVVMGGGPKPEHVMQLNINAFALRKLKFEVTKLQNVLILRDFQNSKAGHDNYPEIPFHVYDIDLMDDADIEDNIADRTTSYELCKGMDDDKIPECTEKQRWFRPGKIAVMKEGRKSAVKLFDDLLPATECKLALNKEGKGKHYIDERPGKNVRCEDYCDVKKWCHFGRELKAKEEE